MNEAEYERALERIWEIFHAKAGTPEGRELESLAEKVGGYEDEHYPIADPSPTESLRFRRQQECDHRITMKAVLENGRYCVFCRAYLGETH